MLVKRTSLVALSLAGCGYFVDVPDHPAVPHLLDDGTCEPGYGNCDGDYDNGCETDFSRDNTCGDCDTSCGTDKCVSISTSPQVWGCDPTQLVVDKNPYYIAPVNFVIRGDTIEYIDADLDARTLYIVDLDGKNQQPGLSAPLPTIAQPYGAIAASSSWVFFSGYDAMSEFQYTPFVYAAADADKKPVKIWEGNPTQGVNDVAVTDSAVYWIAQNYDQSDNYAGADLYRLSLTDLPGGMGTIVYHSNFYMLPLSTDGSNLYWTASNTLGTVGDLWGCKDSDCKGTAAVVPGQEACYWVMSGGGETCSILADSSSVADLYCGADPAEASQLTSFTLKVASGAGTDGEIYAVCDDISDSLFAWKKGVPSCATAACPRVDSHGQPGNVLVHQGRVYWSTADGIFRWAHPFAN